MISVFCLSLFFASDSSFRTAISWICSCPRIPWPAEGVADYIYIYIYMDLSWEQGRCAVFSSAANMQNALLCIFALSYPLSYWWLIWKLLQDLGLLSKRMNSTWLPSHYFRNQFVYVFLELQFEDCGLNAIPLMRVQREELDILARALGSCG